MKKLITSKSAGFCFGVKCSVDMANELLQGGRECFSFGELIHNSAVVNDFSARGLRIIRSTDELPEGASVILRSHGVGRAVYDSLKAKNAQITDATCPKVTRIHKLVSKAWESGRLPVIIGSREHPEVEAIRGWCGDSLVFSSSDELERWLLEKQENRDMPITVVIQTTQTKSQLQKSEEILKKQCTNYEIFDTICSATSTRQEEARKLASICDAMVVIGCKHSANSVHLAKICGEHCMNVQFIESADEFDMIALDEAGTIGITAGASTPAWIIKEVKQKMCDEFKIEESTAQQDPEVTETELAPIPADEGSEKTAEVFPVYDEDATEASLYSVEADVEAESGVDAEPIADEVKPDSEKSFDELLEDSIKTINNGDTVTGIIAAITPTEISVDLLTKQSGYIPVSEFMDDTDNVSIEDIVKVGDSIEACVVRVNDVEGTIMLSKKRLDAARHWNDIEAAQADGSIVEGTVTEENKGGVVVSVKGVRVFVPASQTGVGKDKPMSELLKKKVRLKITEVNRSRRRVVGSIRAVAFKERRERAEKTWAEIEEGKRYTGTVKSLTSYGAFVDIGGVDGMIHVSKLSWSHIKQPSEVLSVGDEVEVYVISFDKENRKISLGYKDPAGDPWAKFVNAYDVDSVINVKIVKLMPFGAFAEVMPGVDGLIHISQIANRRIGKPDEALTVGEYVDAKIIAIDNEKQKISLSIRALIEPASKPEAGAESEGAGPVEDALVYEVSADGESTGVTEEDDDYEAEV